MVEFGGKRLQIDGQGELPVEDGALDLGGLAQLHMEELFKALHDGGEGSLFPREGTDSFVYVKGSEEFFEFDKIGIPVQRRFDLRGRRDEEIRVVRTFLVVVVVENNFVTGEFDCFRNRSFFFPLSTLSKVARRLSKVSETSR